MGIAQWCLMLFVVLSSDEIVEKAPVGAMYSLLS